MPAREQPQLAPARAAQRLEGAVDYQPSTSLAFKRSPANMRRLYFFQPPPSLVFCELARFYVRYDVGRRSNCPLFTVFRALSGAMAESPKRAGPVSTFKVVEQESSRVVKRAAHADRQAAIQRGLLTGLCGLIALLRGGPP